MFLKKAEHRTLDNTKEVQKKRGFTDFSRAKVSSVAPIFPNVAVDELSNFPIPLEEHTYCRDGYARPIWIVPKDTQNKQENNKALRILL